jgi:hypothetical protein
LHSQHVAHRSLAKFCDLGIPVQWSQIWATLPDQDFFINSLDLALTNDESALCDGDVTSAECLMALNSFKNNKSPGIDGLPYELYKCFWPVIGEDLVERKLLSLRAVRLCRYSSPHSWSVFFFFYVSLHFGHPVPDVLACVNIPAYLIKKLPLFYASMIRAWIALRGMSDHGV